MQEKAFKLPAVRPLPIELENLNWWQKLTVWLTYRRKWQLVEDFVFYCPVINQMVRVPTGFIFDFASVPKAFFSFFSPTGFLLAGSIPHDFIYRHGGLLVVRDDQTQDFISINRAKGDAIFKAMGKEISAEKSYKAAWAILQIFGGSSYKPKLYKEGMYHEASI